jgi:hypothetical protein
VKEDEIGAKLRSLRKSEGECLLVGGNLGGEKDGGGFAPSWLDYGGHGNLLLVRQYWQTCGGVTVPGGTGESDIHHFEGKTAGFSPPRPLLLQMDVSCGEFAPRQRILFFFLVVVQRKM